MRKPLFFLYIIFSLSLNSLPGNADIFVDKCRVGNTDYEKRTVINYPVIQSVNKYSVYKPDPYRKNKKERKFYILPEASDGEDKSWYFFFGNNK